MSKICSQCKYDDNCTSYPCMECNYEKQCGNGKTGTPDCDIENGKPSCRSFKMKNDNHLVELEKNNTGEGK